MSRPGLVAGLLVAPLVGLACPWVGAEEVVEAALDNGLRVLLQEDHRSPVASLQVWYRVGSREERVGLTGLSHYLEHMMFKGTPAYGPGVLSKLVETVGGQDNAFTSRDVTAYYVTVAAEQLDLVLELEADRMRHLLLGPREVDAERKVVMEERRTRTEDDPVGALAELFNTVAFAGYPVPNHRSEDAYPLEVLSTVLSGGRTSRLYRRLVYGERLALEAAGDYPRLTLDPDTFTFYVTVLPGRTVEEAERALNAEVERLRTELISEEELRHAQNQLEAAYLFGQDSVFSRSASPARHELLGGWRLRETYLPGIRAVTREDVRRVAERYLAAERRTTAILLLVPPAAARQ